MKKGLLWVFVGLVVVFAGGLCLHHYLPNLKGPHVPTELEGGTTNQSGSMLELSNDELLLSVGNVALGFLSQGAIFAFQEVVSSQGLTFLPYPNDRSVDKNQTFLSEMMSGDEFLALTGVLTRGVRDGSGEDIEMTAAEYYDRFIWDQNYLEAPEVYVNEEIESRGNTLVNLADFFPGAKIIEYHFPGFEEEFAGLDWKSLYLVFVEEDGGIFLRAIAHGEWTI